MLLAADGELYARARASFNRTFEILRGLFKSNDPSRHYDAQDIVDASKDDNQSISIEEAHLGLYLCVDFHVYSTFKPSYDGMGVSGVGIASSVLRFKNSNEAWENREQLTKQAFPARQAAQETFLAVPFQQQDEVGVLGLAARGISSYFLARL